MITLMKDGVPYNFSTLPTDRNSFDFILVGEFSFTTIDHKYGHVSTINMFPAVKIDGRPR